jgi:hypothetical protein
MLTVATLRILGVQWLTFTAADSRQAGPLSFSKNNDEERVGSIKATFSYYNFVDGRLHLFYFRA